MGFVVTAVQARVVHLRAAVSVPWRGIVCASPLFGQSVTLHWHLSPPGINWMFKSPFSRRHRGLPSFSLLSPPPTFPREGSDESYP